jgi:hypothetical protein
VLFPQKYNELKGFKGYARDAPTLNGFIYSITEAEITCEVKGLHDDISREVIDVLSRWHRGH